MNVNYVVSTNELEKQNTSNTEFIKLDDINGYKIFKMSYK